MRAISSRTIGSFFFLFFWEGGEEGRESHYDRIALDREWDGGRNLLEDDFWG